MMGVIIIKEILNTDAYQKSTIGTKKKKFLIKF